MQCPRGDGQLAAHSTQGENNLTVSYSTCPTCDGYWMESFAANFIKVFPDEKLGTIPTTSHCPICQKNLERATGEQIPGDVHVFTCPDRHGYFFPAGQLAAFKSAQKTKIAYHKLWHIPLAGVASVLLAGFALFIVFGNISKRQQTVTQASQILSGQQIIFSENGKSALVSATTSEEVDLIVHIPGLSLFAVPMKSNDKKTHQYVLRNIPTGVYTYSFSIKKDAKIISIPGSFEFTVAP